jgi:GTP cyclohydrolase II
MLLVRTHLTADLLSVIMILCTNNPEAVPELQTYGLTSYQTVITIVKHIMKKLRYKDSAMAGG